MKTNQLSPAEQRGWHYIDGVWVHIVKITEDGVIKTYVNGQLVKEDKN